MAARRPLSTLVAAAAATALAVGGVLVGTAPVSAAPAQSEACTTALEDLEAEFGDVDLSFDELDADVEAEIDALYEAYEEAVAELYASIGLDFYSDDDVYEVELEAFEELEELQEVLDDAQTGLDAADDAVAAAELALVAAQATEDPDLITAAEQDLDDARALQTIALAARDAAGDAVTAAEEELAEITAVVESIDDLDAELEAALDELLGDLPEIDLLRLLELLRDVALECADAPTDTDDSDDDDTDGGSVDRAPVAKPVPARASFTG